MDSSLAPAPAPGLGFVTLLYMGEDLIADVRVRPPQPVLWSQSGSQPESQSESLQSQQQSQSQQSQQQRDQSARIAFGSGGIRVAFLSAASERCPPLMVLHTISANGVWFKLDHHQDHRQPPQEQEQQSDEVAFDKNNASKLRQIYKTCAEEAKTAVVPMNDGSTEVHLVAVKGGPEQGDEGCCFWAFAVPKGLYEACLNMLNMRCLAMVFDLDETLILANTMRSFEDRMEALKIQIDKQRIPIPNKGMDVQKLASLTAELKRYQDDRALLKQYIESDSVIDNGRLICAQLEEVSAGISRPVVRIPEQNLILTRVNPAVRDTSVLVRLRPAWEEFRAYLIAKGRKRFEVFICTMSERDYALEMWRLLDPGARLIELSDLQRRLLCVKADAKKSLSNMFAQLQCHPKLAMVIDDRPEVWVEKDQAQVHAVPAFAPYYAPQAEANSPLPILCIARNVACNVRGGFFKEFDEMLAEKFAQVDFDTDVSTLPNTPFVGNYLSEVQNWAPENASTVLKEFPDGIAGAEVRSALYPTDEGSPGGVRNSESQPSAGGWLEAEDEEEQPQPATNIPPIVSQENIVNVSEKQHIHGLETLQTTSLRQEETNGTKVLRPFEREAATKLESIKASDFISAFQELGEECKTLAEFRCAIRAAEALQFSAEAYFDGNKVGQGHGKTNKEAKSRAAEAALRCIANLPEATATTSETGTGNGNHSVTFNAVAALRDMCSIEGLKVVYLERTSPKGMFVYEVEVGGQILGKGSGRDLESAKHQAAEQALKKHLSPEATATKPQKRSSPPRMPLIQQDNSKRLKGGDQWKSASRKRAKTPPRKPYSRNKSFTGRR